MIKTIFLIFSLQFVMTNTSFGQNINLDEYDIFIKDTLINKSDFSQNGKYLDSTRLKQLTFKPISDGQKAIYYLNGVMYAKGEIKNKKENGSWTYYHNNGQKAREGNFLKGKREGTHKYWYENGNSRGTGNFKNDKYDGKWTTYSEDGKEVTEQVYKNGELVK